MNSATGPPRPRQPGKHLFGQVAQTREARQKGPDVTGRSALPATLPTAQPVSMFVRYFIELPLPAKTVEQTLLTSPAEWLPALANKAEQHGEGLLAQTQVQVQVGVSLGGDGDGDGGRRVTKRVEVELGPVVRYPSRTILALRWRPVGPGASGLLPGLDADLEIGPLGPERTQLSLSGSYHPPFGQLGRLADRVVLHRLAEATVKDFLDRVGRTLTDLGPFAPAPEA